MCVVFILAETRLTGAQELDNKGYICPQCKQSYSPLEVDKLMDFAQGLLLCEICRAEVVDNENAESVQGSKDRMQRFNNQMRFIREGLQKSEAMILPAFDVAAWIKNNPSESDKNKAAATGSGLKVAGADGGRKDDEGVGVMMAMDKDESTRRLERDAEAEVKRQQNALPAWHLKSTITGDLTALGVKESVREAALNGTMSNDDILKGLGVVGGSSRQQGNGATLQSYGAMTEDVKPVINVESDSTSSFNARPRFSITFYLVYDQYYASLAASSAAASAQATPTATGHQSSSSSNSPDFLNDDDRDEKPNVQYLDSLNAYRKRSRSQEDVGTASKIKQAKVDELPPTNGHSYANGNGHLGVNGFGPHNGNGAVSAFAAEAADSFMYEQVEEILEPLDDPPVNGECCSVRCRNN